MKTAWGLPPLYNDSVPFKISLLDEATVGGVDKGICPLVTDRTMLKEEVFHLVLKYLLRTTELDQRKLR